MSLCFEAERLAYARCFGEQHALEEGRRNFHSVSAIVFRSGGHRRFAFSLVRRLKVLFLTVRIDIRGIALSGLSAKPVFRGIITSTRYCRNGHSKCN